MAWLIWHQLLGKPRLAIGRDRQQGSRLGPEFAAPVIKHTLKQSGLAFREFDSEAELCDHAAELLSRQKIIGWFHGRMEFGPRALGCRSILADPRDPEMQTTLNQKIKFRESFRPFAPAVLAEAAEQYFELPPGQSSPYMLLVAPVCESQRTELTAEDLDRQGLDKQAVKRSTIPAVTHVDYSARIQTVDEQADPRFRSLLESFNAKTGCPILINTSFNVRDEPIVCTPLDAIRCFQATQMDALVIGNCLLLKSEGANGGS